MEKNLKTSSRALGIAAVTQSEDFDMEIDEVGPGPSCARTPARHPPRKGTQSRIPLSDIICKTRKDAPSSPLTDGLEANGKGNVNIVDVEPGKGIRIINNGKDVSRHRIIFLYFYLILTHVNNVSVSCLVPFLGNSFEGLAD